MGAVLAGAEVLTGIATTSQGVPVRLRKLRSVARHSLRVEWRSGGDGGLAVMRSRFSRLGRATGNETMTASQHVWYYDTVMRLRVLSYLAGFTGMQFHVDGLPYGARVTPPPALAGPLLPNELCIVAI